MEWLLAIVTNPLFLTTVVGTVITALEGDWDAFQKFDSFGQAKDYDWGRAAWRAFKGLVIGAVAGLSAIGLTGGVQ